MNDTQNNPKKLFVAGLSYDLNNDQLQEYFAKAGQVVSATVIFDRMTGKSKGFGFVEMSTEEEAKNAIKTLDGTELAGRNIIVKEARPQESRPSGGFSGGFRGGNGGGDRRGGGDRNRNSRDDRRPKRW